MEITKKSAFQYATPKIINFLYRANVDSEQMDWTIGIKHSKKIIRDSDKHATVTLSMQIDSFEDESPFSIKFTIMAEFMWEDLDEDTLKILLNQNAPSLLVGFARPIISNFTNNSGFIPFNIPMINFTNEPIDDISVSSCL